MRRPMRSISEGPTRPHAADSQRWWKAGEGGVVKRETRPPPEGLPQTGLEPTPEPAHSPRHGKRQLEKQKAGSRSS